jgi:hypothetical protein
VRKKNLKFKSNLNLIQIKKEAENIFKKKKTAVKFSRVFDV